MMKRILTISVEEFFKLNTRTLKASTPVDIPMLCISSSLPLIIIINQLIVDDNGSKNVFMSGCLYIKILQNTNYELSTSVLSTRYDNDDKEKPRNALKIYNVKLFKLSDNKKNNEYLGFILFCAQVGLFLFNIHTLHS